MISRFNFGSPVCIISVNYLFVYPFWSVIFLLSNWFEMVFIAIIRSHKDVIGCRSHSRACAILLMVALSMWKPSHVSYVAICQVKYNTWVVHGALNIHCVSFTYSVSGPDALRVSSGSLMSDTLKLHSLKTIRSTVGLLLLLLLKSAVNQDLGSVLHRGFLSSLLCFGL